MQRPGGARLSLLFGALAEIVLCLFPPMRVALQSRTESMAVTLGRTEHQFLFSHTRGGWLIDLGRFVVYTVLIASATAAAAVLTRDARTSGDTPA